MSTEPLNRERISRVVHAMPALCGVPVGKPVNAKTQMFDESTRHGLLEDYFRVMEIAHYVRRGGVKAVMYRIETGRAQLAPNDYFDEASRELCETIRGDEAMPVANDQPVLERLSAVTAEEEETVREFLPEIDHFLLSEKRRGAGSSES